MKSRFKLLQEGAADDVIEELEATIGKVTRKELVAVLTNALGQIAESNGEIDVLKRFADGTAEVIGSITERLDKLEQLEALHNGRLERIERDLTEILVTINRRRRQRKALAPGAELGAAAAPGLAAAGEAAAGAAAGDGASATLPLEIRDPRPLEAQS